MYRVHGDLSPMLPTQRCGISISRAGMVGTISRNELRRGRDTSGPYDRVYIRRVITTILWLSILLCFSRKKLLHGVDALHNVFGLGLYKTERDGC